MATDKLELIRKVVSFHPGYGTKYGYSWYEGGMRDTGDWYYMKLLDATSLELNELLAKLEEDSKPLVPLSPEDEKLQSTPTMHVTKDGRHIFSNVLQDKLWEELGTKMERQLLWGKR